jgi:hypothetical protein
LFPLPLLGSFGAIDALVIAELAASAMTKTESKTESKAAWTLLALLGRAAQEPAGLELSQSAEQGQNENGNGNGNGNSNASFVSPSTLATLGGTAGLVVVLWLVAFALRPNVVGKASVAVLMLVDTFDVKHSYADREVIRARKTKLGGGCTLLALGTIAALALSIVVQRRADNTLVQSSLLPLDASTALGARALFPARAPPVDALPFALEGVTLLVAAQRGTSSNASENFEGCTPTFADFNANAVQGTSFGTSRVFSASTSASASSRAPTTVSWITCPDCLFTSVSRLELALPYACQALMLGIVTTDVFGVATLQAQAALARQGVAYSALRWAVTPLLQRLDDVVNSQTRRGHVAFTSALDATEVSVTATSVLVPNAAAVRVSISLSASQLYAYILATEKQTTLQLVSSLVGLLGILGAFATAFKVVERLGRATRWCSLKKTSALDSVAVSTSTPVVRVLSSMAQHEASECASVVHVNPLGVLEHAKRATAARVQVQAQAQDQGQVQARHDDACDGALGPLVVRRGSPHTSRRKM